MAPLACKIDKLDARVLALRSRRDLVAALWLPDATIRRERELGRFRLRLVGHRGTPKNRVHATLITFGHPGQRSVRPGWGASCSDRVAIPDRGRSNVDAGLEADRRARAADRLLDGRARAPGLRSSLHPAAGDRARVWLD